MTRGGSTHEEGDVPSLEVVLDVGEALVEEGVVTQVRVREVGDGGEVDYPAAAPVDRDCDCEVDGMIIDSTLGALHPIDDASAFRGGWSIAPHCDSWVLC